jgi:hypothetical protein
MKPKLHEINNNARAATAIQIEKRKEDEKDFNNLNDREKTKLEIARISSYIKNCESDLLKPEFKDSDVILNKKIRLVENKTQLEEHLKTIKIPTNCRRCERLLEDDGSNRKYLSCDVCKQFTPNKNYDKDMKGGDDDMTEKKQTTPKKPVVKKEKKIDESVANAEKVLDFISKDLKVIEIQERLKILGKAYRLLASKK